jgi:hypothetical protein
MVYGTLAAAKAGNRAATISVAIQALHLANRTLAAANGFASRSRALDGGVVTLAAGVHQSGATSVTSGTTCEQVRVIVQGDPDDADPRANCIWRAGQTPTMRGNLWHWRNLTVEMGGATFLGSNTGRRVLFENVTAQGAPGQETATNNISASTPATGEFSFEAYGLRWWRYGVAVGASNNRKFCTVRNLEFGRSVQALCLVNAVRIADATVPVESRGGAGPWDNTMMSGDMDGAADCIAWNVGSFFQDGAIGFNLPSGVASGGTPANPNIVRRLALVNVLIEKVGTGRTSDPFAATAGDIQIYDCIMDGCTFLGQRVNWGYDQPSDNATPMWKIGNVRRNIHTDRMAVKGDQEVPQNSRTANWSEMHMVGGEGCTFMNRVTSAGFLHEFWGVRSTVDPVTLANPGPGNNAGWPQFTADRSQFSGGPTDGGGDYRPAAGSPLRDFGAGWRCIRSTCDTYRDGTLKQASGFAAGSERPVGEPAPPAVLAGASAAHALADSGTWLGWAGQLGPAAGLHGQTAGAPWLVPAGAAGSGGPGARMLRVAPETRVFRIDPD